MSKTKENAKVNGSTQRFHIGHLDALLNLLTDFDGEGVESVKFDCRLEDVDYGVYRIIGGPVICDSKPPCKTRSQWEELFWQNFGQTTRKVIKSEPGTVSGKKNARTVLKAAKNNIFYLEPDSISISIYMKKNRCDVQNVNHIYFQDMYNVLPSREFRYGSKCCKISYDEYSTIKTEDLSKMSALEFDKFISGDLRKSTGDAKTFTDILEGINPK